MTHDIDSRLEAALHRIAVAHVPDDPRRDLAQPAHADEESFVDTDAATPADAQRPGGRSDRVKHRWLVQAAAGALILAGIGTLLVLAPSNDNGAAPAQSVSPPAQSASPEGAPRSEVPLTTLGVTDPAAGPDAWSRLSDHQLEGRSEHLVVATGGGLFVWGGVAGSQTLTDGAFYESSTGQWRTIPPAPLASDRGDAIGVWTGSEVVVMNGQVGQCSSATTSCSSRSSKTVLHPRTKSQSSATSRAVTGRSLNPRQSTWVHQLILSSPAQTSS